MKYTLDILLEKNLVKIPLIQRDYAQGRTSEIDLRIDFINKIFHSLDLIVAAKLHKSIILKHISCNN